MPLPDPTIVTVSVITVAGLVKALQLALEHKTKKDVSVVTVQSPVADPKNGNYEKLFDVKLTGLRDIIQRDLDEQEQRVTRHKEDLLKEMDNAIKRMDIQRNKIEAVDKALAVLEIRVSALEKK